jgi:hypothetical protein
MHFQDICQKNLWAAPLKAHKTISLSLVGRGPGGVEKKEPGFINFSGGVATDHPFNISTIQI